MPLESIHKFAFKAAEAANCAGEQGKYWEMHDQLFENQTTLEPWNAHAEALGLDVDALERCLTSGKFAPEIRRDMGEAQKVGVTGTPAFMLARTDPISSRVRILAVLKGAQPFTSFKVEIDRLLTVTDADDPGQPEPGAPTAVAPARLAPAVPTKTIDSGTQETLAGVLGLAPEGSPVWIAAPESDQWAIARAEDLEKIFVRAGWRVRAVTQSAVSVRPGTYLFAAEEQPPAYVDTVRQALELAGLSPTVATGYRQYYGEMTRNRPGFSGFLFAPEQTFLLVVGRLP